MKLLVYGSQEFGEVSRSLLKDCGHEFLGYIDDFSQGEEIVGTCEECYKRYPPGVCGIVIAIGYRDLVARWRVYQKVRELGYDVPALVHPEAYVQENGLIKSGAMVMARSVVDYAAEVGELAVLWPGVIVNHHSCIGSNTFLSPNATICGVSTVGRNCFVGAGAVIVDHVNVQDGTFIKAGRIYTLRSSESHRSKSKCA